MLDPIWFNSEVPDDTQHGGSKESWSARAPILPLPKRMPRRHLQVLYASEEIASVEKELF